jgi:hypothetical protein
MHGKKNYFKYKKNNVKNHKNKIPQAESCIFACYSFLWLIRIIKMTVFVVQ